MRLLDLTLLSFAAFSLAKRLGSFSRLKQTVEPPKGWTRRGTPHPDSLIGLRIGLTQPNIPLLQKALLEISDPDHERYGQHLSKAHIYLRNPASSN